MSRLWHNKKLFALALLAILTVVTLPPWLAPETSGALLARFDLDRGHYAIHTYGLNPARREYAQLLKERYGIHIHIDAFCLVSESQRKFADTYNKLSEAAANKRFGHDVFKECYEDARHEWEAARASEHLPSY